MVWYETGLDGSSHSGLLPSPGILMSQCEELRQFIEKFKVKNRGQEGTNRDLPTTMSMSLETGPGNSGGTALIEAVSQVMPTF